MRVLKHGPKPPPAEDIPCTCTHCRCHFVFHESEAFKNQLAEPSKSSGDVIFEMKGFYIPTPAEPT